jgi:hypothetical protein
MIGLENHDDIGNEFYFIMKEYEMHQVLFKENLDEANCGTLLKNQRLTYYFRSKY